MKQPTEKQREIIEMYRAARKTEMATYMRNQQAERLLIAANDILSGGNIDPDCKTSLMARIDAFTS